MSESCTKVKLPSVSDNDMCDSDNTYNTHVYNNVHNNVHNNVYNNVSNNVSNNVYNNVYSNVSNNVYSKYDRSILCEPAINYLNA